MVQRRGTFYVSGMRYSRCSLLNRTTHLRASCLGFGSKTQRCAFGKLALLACALAVLGLNVGVVYRLAAAGEKVDEVRLPPSACARY